MEAARSHAILTQTLPSDPEIEAVASAFAGVELIDWAVAAAIIVGAFVVSRIVRRTVKRIAEDRRSSGLRTAATALSHVVFGLGIIYAISSLGVQITPLLGVLGILGFALAFALQDILENFAASILLQFRRPFRPGDEVESEDFSGTVSGVDSRTVTIISAEGNTVRLPSADVLKAAIVNHSTIDRRRTSLTVAVAYDTDLDEATQILAEAAAEAKGVHVDPAPEALVFRFNDSGIDIAVRFWHDPSISERWIVRDAVARNIHRRVNAAGIEIPFPQRVLRVEDAVEIRDRSA